MVGVSMMGMGIKKALFSTSVLSSRKFFAGAHGRIAMRARRFLLTRLWFHRHQLLNSRYVKCCAEDFDRGCRERDRLFERKDVQY
jgi:hypothetical protein